MIVLIIDYVLASLRILDWILLCNSGDSFLLRSYSDLECSVCQAIHSKHIVPFHRFNLVFLKEGGIRKVYCGYMDIAEIVLDVMFFFSREFGSFVNIKFESVARLTC